MEFEEEKITILKACFSTLFFFAFGYGHLKSEDN